LTNNLSKIENGPIDVFENRPSEQLVHSYGRGKKIGDKELEELALKKFHINGRGITFFDLTEEYGCSKRKAQTIKAEYYVMVFLHWTPLLEPLLV
jgi:hypothetical protein